jgi:hypothetical protein
VAVERVFSTTNPWNGKVRQLEIMDDSRATGGRGKKHILRKGEGSESWSSRRVMR